MKGRLSAILRSLSKTLATTLATFCFGIVVGSLAPAGWWQALLVLTICATIVVCFVRPRRTRFLAVLVSVFLFAIFRTTQTSLPSNVPTVADAPTSAVRIAGIVDAEVERRVSAQRIILSNISFADDSVAGRLLVWTPLYPQVGYGDTLVFNCRVARPEPFEGFAYDRYLASHGILAVCLRPEYIDVTPRAHLTPASIILSIKTFLLSRLQEATSEPHASFLAGLLFGGSASLGADLKDDFAATGTAHILAASGFNVSLFSMAFLGWILTTRVGRRRGLILAATLLVVYVIAAGATPAVVRAGIMGSLVIVQKAIARRGSLTNILLLTAAVMLLVNPLLLRDVGFQLSFVATVAILFLTTPIAQRLAFIPASFGLRESFAGSLAAIAATIPILLWHFGVVSLVSPFANLLVLPLVPYAMALTGIGLLAAIASSTVGAIALLPAWALSFTMLTIVSLFGAIPFAQI